MRLFLFSTLSLCAAIRAATITDDTTPSKVVFPSSRPSSAVRVPADFLGFGFESAFLNSYDNEFSNNLVNSVAARMSVPPIIRIGGTSGDRFTFDPSQQANITCVSGQCPNGGAADFILGPGYFEGFKSFSQSPMTFQAPLTHPLNITNMLDYVRRAYNALGQDRVAAIAIGNEITLHDYEKTAKKYVNNAHRIERNISEALSLGDSNNIFEVLDMSSGSVDKQNSWTLTDGFNAGLNNNNLVKYAAEHWYQIGENDKGASSDGIQQIMNHTAIKQKFRNHEKSLAYLNSHGKVPYVLSETGSSLSGGLDLSGVFGDCLWSVDFQLYAMSNGVARVASTQRPVSKHGLWTPLAGLPGVPGPSVRPLFYAQAFIADFLGKSGKTNVVEMNLQSDVFTAYAAYEESTLARIALVNMRQWHESGGKQRGNHTFSVKVPGNAAQVTVQELHADAGSEALGFDLDPKQNITWAGYQWSYGVDNGKGHQVGSPGTNVQVRNGVATVEVLNTEAVILHITN